MEGDNGEVGIWGNSKLIVWIPFSSFKNNTMEQFFQKVNTALLFWKNQSIDGALRVKCPKFSSTQKSYFQLLIP